MSHSYLLLTLFFSFLSVLGFLSGLIHPAHCEWLGFFGLILLPVLAVNLLLALTGLLSGNRWGWLPLGTIVLNIGYITAIFQLTICPKAAGEQKTIKVASYNVNNFYTNKVHTLSSIAAYMKDEEVDVICLQEVANIDSMLQQFAYMPYLYQSERSKGYLKQVVFSRYPLSNCQTILFSGSRNLSIQADVEFEGNTIRVFSNHLQTTSVNSHKRKLQSSMYHPESFNHAAFHLTSRMEGNNRLRASQADSICQLIEASPYPVVVCGDFNDTPASYAYHRIKGNLTDGFEECGTGYGYTFRELQKLFRIDYIFHSDKLKGIRHKSPDSPWSDHKVVVWEGYLKK